MTKTNRALLLSVVSLVLCMSMLVGSTYAWFTDSATSASNVITAGNLDIEVQYTLDGENWADLDGADDLFQKGLWEPGHTEVVALRIKNNGSLALKYVANMNIVNEVVGKNKEGKDIVLSDILTVTTITHEVNMVGDILLGMVFGGSKNTDTSAVTTFKNGNILQSEKELLPGAAHYVIVTVDMAETVGNEANHDGTNVPSITFGLNVLATQHTHEEDSFGSGYDKNVIIVTNHDEAQAALDELASGTTIQLVPGVDYGTLEVRANITLDGKTPVPGNANTEKVDFFTSKYTNEFVRKLENVTIIGAPGAMVESIKFVGSTHKITGASGGTMYRFVDVKNLVIDSVEFTDTSVNGAGAGFVSPIFVDLQNTHVDGLTVKNCKLEGNNSKMNFVYAYGNTAGGCNFEASLKNVTLENNTVSGIARLCELRECENVTIKGNTVKNLVKEVALLANNPNKAYSGELVFSDNNADTFGGFFVRVGVAGDANILVKNNTIANCGYSGLYPDYAQFAYVSATNHTGTMTVEGNTLN